MVLLQIDDQGLLNTDPRNIAIVSAQANVTQYINNFPTDVQGISFSRTPAQVTDFSESWLHKSLASVRCFFEQMMLYAPVLLLCMFHL